MGNPVSGGCGVSQLETGDWLSSNPTTGYVTEFPRSGYVRSSRKPDLPHLGNEERKVLLGSEHVTGRHEEGEAKAAHLTKVGHLRPERLQPVDLVGIGIAPALKRHGHGPAFGIDRHVDGLAQVTALYRDARGVGIDRLPGDAGPRQQRGRRPDHRFSRVSAWPRESHPALQ